MGKQKSFIIVGSTFAAAILLLILITVLTKTIGIKESKFGFDDQEYYIELGKSQALSPNLYAGGSIDSDMDFQYVAEKSDVVVIEKGTYASGASAEGVYCWSFLEVDAKGNNVEKTSFIPHNENDEITIVNGYWHVNGEKTNCKAERDYPQDEIMSYATISTEKRQIICYILNGIQTNIPYNANVEPVRNESTGTWFIDGEDTGYKYAGIQATIYAKKIGTTKLTVSGIVNGKELTTSVTIHVCLPNPNKVVTAYAKNTKIVNINKEFTLEHTVLPKDSSVEMPLQDVTYTIGAAAKDALTVNENNVFKATATGSYNVRIAAPKASFTIGLSKYESTYVNATIIVVDATDEQVVIMQNAIEAIAKYEEKVNEIKSKTKKVEDLFKDQGLLTSEISDLLNELDSLIKEVENLYGVAIQEFEKVEENNLYLDAEKKVQTIVNMDYLELDEDDVKKTTIYKLKADLEEIKAEMNK